MDKLIFKNSYDFFDEDNVNEISKLADKLVKDGEEELAKEVFEMGLLVMNHASIVGKRSLKLEKKLNKKRKYKNKIVNKWKDE